MSGLTDFERGQIVGAHAVGLSVKEIAQLCDVSSQTVLEVLNMYNIPVNNASAEKTSEQRAKKKRKRQKIADANGGANSQATLLNLRCSVTETPTSENIENPVTNSDVTETQFTLTAVSENSDSEVNTQKLDSNQGAVSEKPISETSNPEAPGTETDMTKPEEDLRT